MTVISFQGKWIPYVMEPNAGGRLKFIEENITKIKPLAYNIFGGILLISDYDFLKHIFSQRSGSHRLSIHKITLDEELREQDYGMFEKTNEVKCFSMHQDAIS